MIKYKNKSLNIDYINLKCFEISSRYYLLCKSFQTSEFKFHKWKWRIGAGGFEGEGCLGEIIRNYTIFI